MIKKYCQIRFNFGDLWQFWHYWQLPDPLHIHSISLSCFFVSFVVRRRVEIY